MGFNWDNPNLIINYWLPCAGGEFINRCLSVSSKMIMLSNITGVKMQLMDTSNYYLKLHIFEQQEPKSDRWWHKNFLASNLWLAVNPDLHTDTDKPEGILPERIFEDAHLANRLFYDKFWRPMACDISQRDLGIVLKAHTYTQIKGLKHLMPQARVTACLDYDNWQARCTKMDKIGDKFVTYYQQNLPADFAAFRFNIDALIKDEVEFISQMQLAYKYLKFPDFEHAKSTLISMRKIYLRWHVTWQSNNR